ncbi:hypothetical protein [Clostridium sp. B9]|uniref:hypothetical protein n=1 Tax=Clostridium sp. B9 TaxID=3423224 RepID=UPI003D2F25DE
MYYGRREVEKPSNGFTIFFIMLAILIIGSDIGNIVYVQVMGKENIGEIVSFDQQTARMKGGSREVYSPVVEVNDDGEIFRVIMTSNQTSLDMRDPIGTKVRVKYIPDNNANIIINEPEYLMQEIVGQLNFISFGLLFFMLSLIGFKSNSERRINFNLNKSDKIKFVLSGLILSLVSLLNIYYIVVIRRASLIESIGFTSIISIFSIIFYIFAIIKFIKISMVKKSLMK